MSLHLAHHDGSERYVSHRTPVLDDLVTVRLRIPRTARAARVFVRTTPDSEPRFTAATVEAVSGHDTWWQATVTMSNPVMRYRFLLEDGTAPYRWVNALGTFERDVTDGADFWLTTAAAPPVWLDDAVVHQIFTDRYARSNQPRHWPSWAIASGWHDEVSADWKTSTRQLFGGDLAGIERHLDHIIALGANVIYLTPFFPATSAHRYDASSFDRVDELLGGDQGLIDLVSASHRAGLRVIGDLTTNHTGDTHDWFVRGRAERTSPEASMYFLDPEGDGYVGWFGHRSLPKLDHRSNELEQRMLVGSGSVTGRWLQPPFELDGWRVDVANMTGRIGAVDTNRQVARTMRSTIAEVRPDAWLLAEHCSDATADLTGDGWHGTMNYAGFTRPAWSWLRGQDRAPDNDIGMLGYPSPPPCVGGTEMAATMTDFIAAMPWRSTAASMTLLGSHDTARWGTVAGSVARQLTGLGLLVGFPGVPCTYYGDEIGVGGADSDLGRAPMEWDESRWDQELLAGYRHAIAIRRTSSALQRGGLRWVHTSDDVVVFLRESLDETVLVQVARCDHSPVSVDIADLGFGGDATAATYLVSLLGHAHLRPDCGMVSLPTEGPRVHAWRVEPTTDEGAS